MRTMKGCLRALSVGFLTMLESSADLDFHAIASQRLGPVEGRIGPTQDLGGRLTEDGLRHSKAGREVAFAEALGSCRHGAYSEPLGDLDRGFQGQTRQQDDKLFSTEPGDQVH